MFRIPWRPRVEVPEFNRCCFCLPLRPGLLVWGYIKMAALSVFGYILIEDLIRMMSHSYFRVPTVMILLVCFVVIDIMFTIGFIVAGHMKHPQLFRMYYYYSLVSLGIFFIGYMIVLGVYFYTFRNLPAYIFLWTTLDSLYTAVPLILVQLYLSLLVKSELRKLSNNSNFQFVNTAAEASCSLDLNNVTSAAEP
ncbi:uncharacterized protein LOC135077869 [Ostrinia nubilalis]|uniref:uncharacterized protein LOC114366406 n=1 Tax=Ostrinia furnacalis TaxID=93504 RepID=UPI00104028D4|nr:uncharacterized protein LOC114366406 [Ostrinia furnacalis]